jgi:hypothetical protein
MQLASFQNLELMTGENAPNPLSVGPLRRGLAGAAVGLLVGLAMLVFVAGLVQWSAVLWLWPNTTAIGASFGGIIAILHKPCIQNDLRFGEAPLTGRPLDLR